jgi:hypothetical protein
MYCQPLIVSPYLELHENLRPEGVLENGPVEALPLDFVRLGKVDRTITGSPKPFLRAEEEVAQVSGVASEFVSHP